jgi:hypothetical protein
VYAVLVLRLVRSRRMPMDWTAWHAIAGAGWLVFCGLAGFVVATHGAIDELGARVAAAYGVAGIVGWMSNLIVGVSYKLFPGFVAAARSQRERRPVPLAVLGVPRAVQALDFPTLNGGTLLVVMALLAGRSALLPIGGGVLAVAGLVYAAASERTLLFTLRDPRGRPHPLAVLP